MSWEAGGEVEACGELGLVLGDGGAVVEFHEADGGGGLVLGWCGLDGSHVQRVGVVRRPGAPKAAGRGTRVIWGLGIFEEHAGGKAHQHGTLRGRTLGVR